MVFSVVGPCVRDQTRRRQQRATALLADCCMPPRQWGPFCAAFSQKHHGQPTTLWVGPRELASDKPREIAGAGTRLATELALQRIDAGRGGSGRQLHHRARGSAQRPMSLRITLGDGPSRFEYRVRFPTRIALQIAPSGAPAGLAIDAADDQLILLRFDLFEPPPSRPG